MKKGLLISFLLMISYQTIAQLTISQVGQLPVRVSNNAVCEGFIGNNAYAYSFAGIDSTKTYEGIHLKSFRYDLQTSTVTQLPDLPDTLGKIACAASRVGNIIYISGGYHVFADHSELSSNKMHRFDIVTNTFLSDGADIPVATDDHVQVVWRDSLIFLISGWSNTGNISDVQIYNPALDNWTVGTGIPNNHIYRSFGASGVIFGDTIYYFGGARSSFGFNIQNFLRKGIINPDDPSQIEWSYEVPDENVNGYRMAATTVKSTLHWIGGSNVTYNYDGIAYNGSGGVPPANRDLYTSVHSISWSEDLLPEIPMDLRGIASINDSVKYIMGGMIANQEVTNTIYKLEWDCTFLDLSSKEENGNPVIYPNPFNEVINIKSVSGNQFRTLSVYNAQGEEVISQNITNDFVEISTIKLSSGLYYLVLEGENNISTQKLVKH